MILKGKIRLGQTREKEFYELDKIVKDAFLMMNM